jgi:hypothetical protein
MKTMLALIGAFTILLGLLGAFGVGNFVMMYSPDKISCYKGVDKINERANQRTIKEGHTKS